MNADLSIEDFQCMQFFIHTQFLKPWYHDIQFHGSTVYICVNVERKNWWWLQPQGYHVVQTLFSAWLQSKYASLWNMLPFYVQCYMLSGLHSSPPKNVVMENVTYFVLCMCKCEHQPYFPNLKLFIRTWGITTISCVNLSVLHDQNPETVCKDMLYCTTLQVSTLLTF